MALSFSEHGFASVTMLSAFSHSYLDGSKLVARLVAVARWP